MLSPKRIALVLSLCLLTVAIALPATAESPDMKMKEHVLGEDIRWISGGFGTDERKMMMDLTYGFDVKLEFALTSGEYIGNVDVAVTKAGTDDLVFADRSPGPWMLIKLPQGKYDIAVEYKKIPKSVTVTVGDKMVTRGFAWSADKVGYEPAVQ
jgi:hypothetical protein